jgi:ArsR family transcriptional regulator, arsenate/arsenite/antimonite-responsive transcriptional repressor
MFICAIAYICQAVYNCPVKSNPTTPSLDLLFRALADRTRLRLLNLIADREICVCYFVDILGDSQPKISRHLAYLRNAGVVVARRQGRWMHYRLSLPQDGAAAGILRETLAHLRTLPKMQADLEKLEKTCCCPNSVSEARRPPQPLTLPTVGR